MKEFTTLEEYGYIDEALRLFTADDYDGNYLTTGAFARRVRGIKPVESKMYADFLLNEGYIFEGPKGQYLLALKGKILLHEGGFSEMKKREHARREFEEERLKTMKVFHQTASKLNSLKLEAHWPTFIAAMIALGVSLFTLGITLYPSAVQ